MWLIWGRTQLSILVGQSGIKFQIVLIISRKVGACMAKTIHSFSTATGAGIDLELNN